jgi:hypothetical protein
MKTKDLIAMLRELNPAGEEQCCIDNAALVWNQLTGFVHSRIIIEVKPKATE